MILWHVRVLIALTFQITDSWLVKPAPFNKNIGWHPKKEKRSSISDLCTWTFFCNHTGEYLKPNTYSVLKQIIFQGGVLFHLEVLVTAPYFRAFNGSLDTETQTLCWKVQNTVSSISSHHLIYQCGFSGKYSFTQNMNEGRRGAQWRIEGGGLARSLARGGHESAGGVTSLG